MMGNLAGWIHEAMMHEVCGVLNWKTHQAMNKDARVELYFDDVKLCICSAWFLVHLPSHWTKEHCVEVGVMYAAPSVFFSRSCKRLVDNKYSSEA